MFSPDRSRQSPAYEVLETKLFEFLENIARTEPSLHFGRLLTVCQIYYDISMQNDTKVCFLYIISYISTIMINKNLQTSETVAKVHQYNKISRLSNDLYNKLISTIENINIENNSYYRAIEDLENETRTSPNGSVHYVNKDEFNEMKQQKKNIIKKLRFSTASKNKLKGPIKRTIDELYIHIQFGSKLYKKIMYEDNEPNPSDVEKLFTPIIKDILDLFRPELPHLRKAIYRQPTIGSMRQRASSRSLLSKRKHQSEESVNKKPHLGGTKKGRSNKSR